MPVIGRMVVLVFDGAGPDASYEPADGRLIVTLVFALAATPILDALTRDEWL